MEKTDLLKIVASTPPKQPDYLIGEKDNYIKSFESIKQPLGGTIQGVPGNGKTHFIRYAKTQLKADYNVFVIEDMFQQSDFKTALQAIYKRLIKNDSDDSHSIKNLAQKISQIDVKLKKLYGKEKPTLFEWQEEVEYYSALKRFPSRILTSLRDNIDDKQKIEVLISFFSGEDVKNNAQKKILKDLNLDRKNVIESESDFVDYFVDYIELVYALTNKPTLIFMDEADRALLTTNKILLPKVGFQILDSLREVFNKIRTPTFFAIGTTTQAWKLIETSSEAFTRRFNTFQLILKEEKTAKDVRDFIKVRCEEAAPKIDFEGMISAKILNEELFLRISLLANTWRQVIDLINNYANGETLGRTDRKKVNELSREELQLEILSTLYIFRALKGVQIINNNSRLTSFYPSKKDLPTSVFNNLYKQKLIDRFKDTKDGSYTYQITPAGEEFVKKKNQ